MNRLAIFLYLLLSISLTPVFGQELKVNYRHVGLPDGISHQRVNCILQDSRGLMWVGTYYGLNRYDGKQFDIWTKEEDGLSNDKINHLMEDQAGWIWAITVGNRHHRNDVRAISLVHTSTDEVQSFSEKFGQAAPFDPGDIEHFFSGPDRQLYFWTNHQFWVYSLDQGFEQHPCPKGVRPFSMASSTSFWGRTMDTIVQFDQQGQIRMQQPYPFDNTQSIIHGWLVGSQSGVWLGQHPNHFQFLSSTSASFIQPKAAFVAKTKEPHFDRVRKWLWYADNLNVVAFDTLGNSVFDFHKIMGKYFDVQVHHFFVDQEGLVWLGTREGFYIMEVKKSRFQRYLYTDQVTPDNKPYKCRGILEHEGQLFVNTYQGTMKIDLEQGQVTKLGRLGLPTDSPIHQLFHKKPDGSLWSLAKHLTRFDGQTGARIDFLEIPQSRRAAIKGIHTDRKGTTWIDIRDGIVLWKNNEFYPFRAYNGFVQLEKSQVFFFHENKQGQLWLATDSGLYLVDPEEGVMDHFWSSGKGDHYLPGKQIQHIHEDEAGNLWLATEHQGLIRWHPETKEIRHLTRKDGLPTNTIYAVYEDQKGLLWISSYFGLIQMDKQTFRKKIYLTDDGISGTEFNRLSHYQSPTGRIYFGGQNGVTAFDPSDFWEDWNKNEQLALQVYQFTEGHDFGEQKVEALDRLLTNESLSYPYSVRNLSLRLKTPNYYLADKISYYYRIQPIHSSSYPSFSGEWVKNEGSTINLSGVTPGQYELTIEARGLDRERIGQPIRREIIMNQPFYSTWLFRGVMVFIVLFSFGLFTYLRARNNRKQRQLLEQKVEERTQQILKDQQIIQQQAKQIRELDSLLSQADQRWAIELDEIVRERLNNFDLNTTDIADEMNLSRTRFFQKTKSVTGLTPNQYLREARLKEAKRLLESGEYTTLKAVSLSVGFKKPSYFSTLFKERFGNSPTNYFQQN